MNRHYFNLPLTFLFAGLCLSELETKVGERGQNNEAENWINKIRS